MIAAIVSLVATTTGIFFYACQKDDNLKENTSPSSSEKQISFAEIDAISSEVADFHGYAIKAFLNDMYKTTDVLDEEYTRKLNDFVCAFAQQYKWKHLNSKLFYQANIPLSHAELKQIIDDSNHDKMPKTSSTVSIKCRYIESKAKELFETSVSLQRFKIDFAQFVETELSDVTDTCEYFEIRIFADVFVNSLETWGEYMYGDIAKNACESSWWNKIKSTASDVWNNIKPVVAADANGAVVGAMGVLVASATAAPVTGGLSLSGIAVGAGGGAVVASAGSCVENIINR